MSFKKGDFLNIQWPISLKEMKIVEEVYSTILNSCSFQRYRPLYIQKIPFLNTHPLYSYNSYIYYTPLLSQYIICISPIAQLSQQNVIYWCNVLNINWIGFCSSCRYFLCSRNLPNKKYFDI